MPNQSLTDLPERTSTSGSDRIHVNNAGTDYQQTKAKFLVGDLYSVYSNSVSITSTADSLPAPGTYFGYIASYGHQTTVDVPANNNFYVKITRMNNSDYSNIEIWSVNDAEGAHYIRNKVGGSWSNWVQIPHRSEITSLNNSLTNIRTSGQFLGYKDKYITNVSISYDNSYASLGDVYNDFGIPSGAYVTSFNIRGWSGASGTLMLTTGSDGRTIYVMSNKAGTIGSITVRVWYAILN